ncbi:MAG: DUF1207 domain-containing protein [Pirellulales bacterium]
MTIPQIPAVSVRIGSRSRPARKDSFSRGASSLFTALGLIAIVCGLHESASAQQFAPPPASPEQAYWALVNESQLSGQSRERVTREQAAGYFQESGSPNLVEPLGPPSGVGGPNPQPTITPQQADEFFGTGTAGRVEYVNDPNEPWEWQILPDGLIYRSYLAGDRESRLRSLIFNEKDYGALWDITLGGRIGILRNGTTNAYAPNGWQVDIEGAALPRLDFEHDMNVVSVDFRAGLPITYGNGPWRTKFGYYHLSSHLGDEQLLQFPSTPRYNYSRDCLIFGQSYYATPEFRVYAEAAWAFHCDIAEPWEFQFGCEYAPSGPTGKHGAPFVAANALLREEVDFGGNFVFQVGWAWREGPSAHLLRLGFEYFNGLSDQYQFYNQFEEKLGFGFWIDY